MSKTLITIDCGTTNTRAALWNEAGKCLDIRKAEVGVRNTAIDGNNARLSAGVRQCIDALLSGNGLGMDSVAAVYASGMITSDVGLVVVPHLTAPASRKDFVDGVAVHDLPEVCARPIHFIPGLKNMDGKVTMADVEAMDIMRGEETEALALQAHFPKGKEYLFVLPGSHTKFITVDAAGRMTGCLTSLAGELLACLTEHSILADAVNHQYVSETTYRKDAFLAGFRQACRTSLARTAFSTRILHLFVDKDPAVAASFLLGAVLQNDVMAVKGSNALTASPETRVVISGKEPLSSALRDVFFEDGSFSGIEIYAPPEGSFLSGLGAFSIARERGDF